MFEKKQSINNSSVSAPVIMINGNATIDADIIDMLSSASNNTPLLNRLVRDEIATCKKQILFMNSSEAGKIIDTIFTYGLKGLASDVCKELYYLRYLVFCFNNEHSKAEECIAFFDDVLLKEIGNIDLLIRLERDVDKIHTLRPESQAYILNKIFDAGHYDTILSEQEHIFSSDIDLRVTWDFYCGISYFNQHNFENAQKCLGRVFAITKNPTHKMIAILSKIQNLFLKSWITDVRDEVRDTYGQLEKLIANEPLSKTGNENLILGIELQYYILFDLEKFEEKYEELTDLEKTSLEAKYHYALYFECIGNYNVAIEKYKEIKKDDDSEILFHIMVCYFYLKKWQDVLDVYNLIKESDLQARHKGLMLQSLSYIDTDEYGKQLENNVKLYQDDEESMYFIALASEEHIGEFDKYVYPVIERIMEKITSNQNTSMKFGYANVLLHTHHGNVCAALLKSIEDFSAIDNKAIQYFYRDLYDEDLVEPEDAEQICDIFIARERDKIAFLRIKINALLKQEKHFSAIRSNIELFKLTNDLDDACNIIALAINHDKDNIREYMQYVHILMKSKVPRHHIAVSAAYLQLGKIEQSDAFGYSAIMLLDNKDDFEIYSSYVSLNFQATFEHRNRDIEHDEVKENSAVMLQNDGNQIVICLEDRNDNLNLEDSYAGNAKHIYYTDIEYYQLMGRHVGDEVCFEGKEYKVCSIINKYVYVFRYVLEKLSTNQEKANFPFLALQASSAEEMVEQIKALFPKNEVNDILATYHHRDNDIGTPIECICNRNYDEYVEAIRFLLFGENQALYAGVPGGIANMKEYYYVISISTLVVLSLFDALDLLIQLKDRILIPESTITFLKRCVDNQKKTQVVSAGKMVSLPDGGITLIPPDKNTQNVWESIIEICTHFSICKVSYDEIIGKDIIQGVPLEILYSFKLEKCQMDSLVLAKRENAIYLSEDLFYRNLASLLHIPNFNMSCIVLEENNINAERTVEIVREMARSNYIYVPQIPMPMASFREMWDDLLKGKYKKFYYGKLFQDARKKAMEVMFSGEGLKEL